MQSAHNNMGNGLLRTCADAGDGWKLDGIRAPIQHERDGNDLLIAKTKRGKKRP